jgi:mannosylglycerate hydrolase MGH1-like protein/glycosyl hydrolase family 63
MPGMTAEHARLLEARDARVPWRRWGPYLSERQWGTVREDRSVTGDAWNDFTHDQARSRAYHWGEDGIAGICDDSMRLCFAIAFWNGCDPILKERLFGLTNGEGNHGEDVKEYYYYLDSTPTHSYMRMLYKYPQRPFPYDDLVKTNRSRNRHDPEYELISTGVFDDNRYFDVFVEYAKQSPEDILIRVVLANRGPEDATLHVLPHLWFRNTWWRTRAAERPLLERQTIGPRPVVLARHPEIGTRYLFVDGDPELLFTENDSNEMRLFGRPNASQFVKDGINERVVHGRTDAVHASRGTKAAAWYTLAVPGGATRTLRLRLTGTVPSDMSDPFAAFEAVFDERAREADEFYRTIIPASVGTQAVAVARQGFAGLLWSKQAYVYDVTDWIVEHGRDRSALRNTDWQHLASADVISMPDKWEYPWFAAWDLAFHAVTLAFVDPDFAMDQLELLLHARYMHPNGQIPAYEWNFSDVNPPVHAWAMLFIYRLRRHQLGDAAIDRMRRLFHKLLLNFTWWVNRKDRAGRNVFEGGFLGLDNIGVFDRSSPLPTGGSLEQADGTSWMALYSQTMLDLAIELGRYDPVYEDFAIKFYDHFILIAAAMDRVGGDGMWDEQDGFFYDVLRLPDNSGVRLKVRSMVGLLPLCGATVYPHDVIERLPRFVEHVVAFRQRHEEMYEAINLPGKPGVQGRFLLSILDEAKLRRVLARLLDPTEFFSDFGIRALSRAHLDQPYSFYVEGFVYSVAYCPAESDSALFGGNSNWRGPVWMPVNALLIRALTQLYWFYGDDFKVECPTGSGKSMTLWEVASEIARRLIAIFLPGPDGWRPVNGGVRTFQEDPYWRDLVPFYEYFHGDNGAGIGASHQTGWTALVAGLICLFNEVSGHDFLQSGAAVIESSAHEQPVSTANRA